MTGIAYPRSRDVYDYDDFGGVLTVGGLPVLSSEDVARILGVKPRTVRQYLSDSRPGGRYASHPFPGPAGRIGRWPYWLPEQAAEIREWDAGRAGQGVGGGRPRKTT